MRSKNKHHEPEETEHPNKPHMYEAGRTTQSENKMTFWSGKRDESPHHPYLVPKGHPERAVRRAHI